MCISFWRLWRRLTTQTDGHNQSEEMEVKWAGLGHLPGVAWSYIYIYLFLTLSSQESLQKRPSGCTVLTIRVQCSTCFCPFMIFTGKFDQYVNHEPCFHWNLTSTIRFPSSEFTFLLVPYTTFPVSLAHALIFSPREMAFLGRPYPLLPSVLVASLR